jgi:hypothetical protein
VQRQTSNAQRRTPNVGKLVPSLTAVFGALNFKIRARVTQRWSSRESFRVWPGLRSSRFQLQQILWPG